MIEVLALDEALDTLAGLSRRQARVAELRLFAGLSLREIATVLEVSEPTVKNEWRAGRAWLALQLRGHAR